MSNSYKGTSIGDLHQGFGPWNYETPPIIPSEYHSVLFQIPISLVTPPEPHKSKVVHHWDDGYVRMPYSEKNLFPSKQAENTLESRWLLIKKSLQRPISSSQEFEEAINSYHTKTLNLTSLHYLFEQSYTLEETEKFFTHDLPKIIDLALQLPTLVPGNIPLLKAQACYSISLSQMQIACLLANAFLCTFPWSKEKGANYPDINFVRLFTVFNKERPCQSIVEKIKCILHYFRRVLKKNPVGVVTFERQHLRRNKIPRWDKCENNLGNTRLHVSSTGTIEDDCDGLMQVDFANKFLGGGVLGHGCVQEEIRFVISPELIISKLFTEKLASTEALIIIGAERYSNYEGYSVTFKWGGDFEDETPYDDDGRRRTSIVAIDATQFGGKANQFHSSLILRELNKAYSGFYSRISGRVPPVGTGNWGCGAFGGDTHLKFLIQLMACSAANRDIVYFTFHDEDLRDDIYNMYIFIANNQITISHLWRILCRFVMADLAADKLFPFIQQSYFDLQKQPPITNFFPQSEPSTSKTSPEKLITLKKPAKPKISPEKPNDCIIPIEDDFEDTHVVKKKCVEPKVLNVEDDFDVLALIGKIEGDKKVVVKSSSQGQGFFEVLNKKRVTKVEEAMEVDVDNTIISEKIQNDKVLFNKSFNSEQRKITDFFGSK